MIDLAPQSRINNPALLGFIKAKSLTHEHLLAIVRTEAARFPDHSTVRILDVGCGRGDLLAYLSGNLSDLTSKKFEFYGFDVTDDGVHSDGYLLETIKNLSILRPDVTWSERIRGISVNESWPYPDDFFDVILSNQVLEHVMDYDHFFSQLRRTLRDGGYCAQVFPLAHCIYESHVNLPFVHRMKNYEFLRGCIKAMSWLGLGNFKSQQRHSGISLDDFSKRTADYIMFFTNYLSHRDALELGKRYKMRASYRYTKEFYERKVRKILGLPARSNYQMQGNALYDWLCVMAFKYVSSVTLFCEKKVRGRF